LSIIHSWTNWLGPIVTGLLIFLEMLLIVELITPKRTCVRVYLIITFAVKAFERIRIWFALLSFKTRRICLKACLVVSGEVTVMFNFVWSIIFNTSRTLKIASKCGMTLLPAILALEYTWVHVGTTNSSNKASDIKASIN